MDFAPTYQTAYEFYYTSTPKGSEESFSDFYDFKFGSINCIAYYDFCSERNVTTWPTTVLYRNGKFLDKVRGAKNMTIVTGTIEKALEEVKPGSRPANLVIPKAGDDHVSPAASASTEKTETAPAEEAAPKEKTEKEDTKEDTPASTKAKADVVPDAKTDDAPPAKEDDAPPAKPAEKPAAQEKKLTVEELAEETRKSRKDPVFPPPTIPFPVRAKSPGIPNKDGVSLALNAEAFQNKVTMTQDPWFVKFYAPWCHHCQALASTWTQVAKDMKGELNVGEVNCDEESRLCKDVGVQGYPTIILFRGGERVEYEGLRGLGDLLHFAESAVALTSGVPEVDAESFKAMEEKEEVIFVYFYDHGIATEDFMALERIPIHLAGRAKLVRTRDPELAKRFKITTWPRLMVAREGRPTYYTPLAPKDYRDVNAMLRWVKYVWLPIVPELTASNAREIMDGKIVVLGILNRNNEEAFKDAQREMKSAANEWMDKQIQLFQLERQELRDAKQLRLEEAKDRNDERGIRQAKAIRINMSMSDKKQVAFAWVDSIFWQRWIRTTYGIDVNDGDRVIINDEDVSTSFPGRN